MQNEMEQALGNLYDLEEDIQIEAEDETPFMTYVRLEEALSQLHQLEQNLEEEIIEKTEEKPLVGVFEELTLIGKDTKGKTHTISAMTKCVFHAEKSKKIKRNPDLICLCSISNSKVYYNIPKDEYWIEVYQPIFIGHKRTMRKAGSVKLEPHDFETLLGLGIAYHRDFHNPLPKQIWVRKRIKRKVKKICQVFNERSFSNDGKILEKPSRKNHCSGKLKLISVEGTA